MGHREASEEHSQPQDPVGGHPSFHRTFPPAPSQVVDKLVRLKDSDPEMFSEAWNRLPDSTRENILAYLKRYPNLLEKEYPLLLLHRAGKLSGDEFEQFEEQAIENPQPLVPEKTEPLSSRQSKQQTRSKKAKPRPLPQPELEAEYPIAPRLSPRVVSSRASVHKSQEDKADPKFLSQLRKMLKQNAVQIDLLQKLLRAYENQV